PADRQRMDVYRRLTRCTSIEMLADLQRDVADAFGNAEGTEARRHGGKKGGNTDGGGGGGAGGGGSEPPRQMTILYALTELRLLASHFGIDSIVRKPPDVVMTVRDARKATEALAKAPGRLTVVDAQTIYFRPPAVFIEPEPLLLTL